MLARWPMIDAGARSLEEPAHRERHKRRGLAPPLLGGKRVLWVLDGHGRAPGAGRDVQSAHPSPNPERAILSPLARVGTGSALFARHRALRVNSHRRHHEMADSSGYEYFSDRESGPRLRTHRDITDAAWQGLRALIRRLIARGDFGNSFPDGCPDSPHPPIGTDRDSFDEALQAEVPDWPGWSMKPSVVTACDFLEFCHRHVAHASSRAHHSFYGHDHLRFDVPAGQASFRDEVNLILRRHGIALELCEDGTVRRLLDDPIGLAVVRARFRTGDDGLDRLLEEARQKFMSPDPRTRQEALERAWDAWERLKTVRDSDKRRGIGALLDACASNPVIRQTLENESKTLTDLGNHLHIRHSETTQTEITDPDHVDYMFQRVFVLLLLILRKNGMVA